MKLKVYVADNKNDLKKVFKIREQVFQEEQGIDRKLDFDGLDKDEKTKNFVFEINGKVVGCARLLIKGKKAKFGRLAILKAYRGKGYGGELTKHIIDYCKILNLSELYMHSQYYLLDFYKNLGFKERGKVFTEVGIKHIEMYMKLK